MFVFVRAAARIDYIIQLLVVILFRFYVLNYFTRGEVTFPVSFFDTARINTYYIETRRQHLLLNLWLNFSQGERAADRRVNELDWKN